MLQRIFDVLESNEFIYKTMVASGTNLFIKIVEMQPEYQELVELVKQDDNYFHVVYHIKEIFDMDFDEQYEHPMDTPVAVYIIALGEVKPQIEIMSRILSGTNFFWSRMVIRRIALRHGLVEPRNDTERKQADYWTVP